MTNTSFINNMVKVLFNMTGNLKGNLSSMFKDNMRCQVMCHSRGILLTQDHLSRCSGYSDLRAGIDFSSDEELVKFFALVMKRREAMDWD